MSNAFYVQKAQNIFPIFGVSSLDEARKYVSAEDHTRIVETADDVYMNPATGSVDFSGNWEAEGVDLADLVLVEYVDEEWISVMAKTTWKAATTVAKKSCANIAEKTVCDTHIPTGIQIYGTKVAKAIRLVMNKEKPSLGTYKERIARLMPYSNYSHTAIASARAILDLKRKSKKSWKYLGVKNSDVISIEALAVLQDK